ncbi:MAG: type II toxin-antitoxin system HicB family antitoxin [Alphaproteobacteria bacterium]|nr:type II toxin-antitoxin system HicB family antitoxin [Alphaproteobacteria bacterium]
MAIETKAYRVVVGPLLDEEGGGFVARVPELPGCVSDGSTPAEAVENVQDAIQAWIASAQEAGDPVPPPAAKSGSYSGKWVQRVPKSLHRLLAERAADEGVSLNRYTTTLPAQGVGHGSPKPRRAA